LGPVFDSDSAIGFGGVLSSLWGGFRQRLQWLIKASPESAECTVREVRAGWVKEEELVEDDMELVLVKGWFHVLNAVDVEQPGDMVKEGWRRPGGNFLVDLEGCATSYFPGIEYIAGGDGAVVFESFDEKGDRCGGAPWVISCVGSRCIGE
jgi:hypothetical protein